MKLLTPEFRASYARVHEPRENPSGQMKYSVQMRFEDTAQGLGDIKEAIKAVVTEKWGKKAPAGLRLPLREDEDGAIFANCSSNDPIPVVDSKNNLIAEGVYSGCYGVAQILIYAYDQAGNRGVGFGLCAFKMTRDGDRLDGRQSAAEIFGAPESGSDDDDIFG